MGFIDYNEDDLFIEIGKEIIEPSPGDYHFYDFLLPFAISNKGISAISLIDLWIFVQRYGNDKETLLQVFFNGDVDQSIKALTSKKIESYTEEELLTFLKKPINYVRDRKINLRDYYIQEQASPSSKKTFEEEPEKERKLIIEHQTGLYNKFVPSLNKVQLKTLWEKAEEKNQIELMCYYYFLNKYIAKYANDAVLIQSNWPKMAQLKENVLPQYDHDEILKNLKLLCNMVKVNMGYDKSYYTLSDILKFIEIIKLIKENRIE